MKEEDIQLLLQAVHALRDSMDKLKKVYNSGKYLELETVKKDMIGVQEKISKILR